MMSNDEGVLLSVLILSIQFDLFFVFCISPVDDHVAGASFTILSGLIVWLGSCLSVYDGFVMGYSCCWAWGGAIACQLFLGSNFVVLSFKMSDLANTCSPKTMNRSFKRLYSQFNFYKLVIPAWFNLSTSLS